MPHDQIVATMDNTTLSDLPPVKIFYHFSNGRILSRGFTADFWGKRGEQKSDGQRRYNIADDHLRISGNIVGFYCELEIDCDTNLLTGTINVSKPLPVAVYLRSNHTGVQVSLPANTLQLDFQLQVGDRR